MSSKSSAKQSPGTKSKAIVKTKTENQATSLTYEAMIKKVFTSVLHKNRKIKDQGATYQQIWKEMTAMFGDQVKKKLFLARLKKAAVSKDTAGDKKGVLVKWELNRYKYIEAAAPAAKIATKKAD